LRHDYIHSHQIGPQLPVTSRTASRDVPASAQTSKPSLVNMLFEELTHEQRVVDDQNPAHKKNLISIISLYMLCQEKIRRLYTQ
jgi:hypothetical protein